LEGYLIALAAALAYAAVAWLGHALGLWKRVGVSFYGPVLMWRTRRWSKGIANAARHRRLWKRYGTMSSVLASGLMLALVLALLWVVYFAPDLPRAAAATAEIGPGLPTDDIMITLVYAVLGMVVAVIVHELAHGVAAIASGVRLDSMGVMFLVIPVGAFVEPNDEDLNKAGPEVRMRIFSSGLATNMVVALACFALLAGVFVPSAEPVEAGALVTDATPGSPGQIWGLTAWTEVLAVGSTNISSAADLMDITFDQPGTPIGLELRYGNEHSQVVVPQGMVITEVTDGPAMNAGLRQGMIIRSINNTPIVSADQLRSVIENSTRSAPVPISVLEYGQDPAFANGWFVEDKSIAYINLTSKWLYYYTHFNWLNKEEYRNQSFMGVSTSPFGLKVKDPEHLLRLYGHPYAGASGAEGVADATVRLLALPFIGYSPVLSPASDLYEPTGALSFLPNDVYWVLVNLLYWIFWGNMMVGLANALPALPLDGGNVFRDLLRWSVKLPRKGLLGLDRVTHRRRLTDPGEDRLVRFLTLVVSAATLLLMAMLVLQPWY
jgi:membrane-associated protease RseP (regulator of RpoE activity)